MIFLEYLGNWYAPVYCVSYIFCGYILIYFRANAHFSMFFLFIVLVIFVIVCSLKLLQIFKFHLFIFYFFIFVSDSQHDYTPEKGINYTKIYKMHVSGHLSVLLPHFRIQREEAKITAWENLQKAKAEAAIRKLEVLSSCPCSFAVPASLLIGFVIWLKSINY